MITAIESIAGARLHRPGDTLSLDPEVEESLVERGAAEWAEDPAAKPKPKPKPSTDTKAASKADGNAPASDGQSGAGDPSPDERQARIRAAVAKLAADPASCTKSGKPTAKAIEAETGLDGVTAKERDAAFDALPPPAEQTD